MDLIRWRHEWWCRDHTSQIVIKCQIQLDKNDGIEMKPEWCHAMVLQFQIVVLNNTSNTSIEWSTTPTLLWTNALHIYTGNHYAIHHGQRTSQGTGYHQGTIERRHRSREIQALKITREQFIELGLRPYGAPGTHLGVWRKRLQPIRQIEKLWY